MPPRKKSNNSTANSQQTPPNEDVDEQELENAFEDDQQSEEEKQEDTTASAGSDKEQPSQESTTADESIFEADLSEEQRLAKAAATINGKVYTFPYNKPDSLQMSLALAKSFVVENLVPGQILTVNLHMNAMLFLPELGVTLNVETPHYEIPEDLSEGQKVFIAEKLRNGALWLGEFEVKKKEMAIATSKIDQKQTLDQPIRELRQELKDLIGKGTKVDQDGTLVSPAVDIKALLEYERENQNRKDYVDLLKRALNKIHGAVEFIDKMTDVKPVGEVPKGETLPPPGPANPNAVKNFM